MIQLLNWVKENSYFGPLARQPFKKLNQIAISDAQIDSVEFSAASNMLLVVSSTR